MKTGHSLAWILKLVVQHFTLEVQNLFNNPTIFTPICRWLLVMLVAVRAPVSAGQNQTVRYCQGTHRCRSDSDTWWLSGHPSVQVRFRHLVTVRAPITAIQNQTVGYSQGTHRCRSDSDTWWLSGHPLVQVRIRQLVTVRAPVSAVQNQTVGDCQGTCRCRLDSDSC